MAISMNEISNEIDNYEPKDIAEKVAYDKILKARGLAYENPKGVNFRETLFAVNLGNDPDVWKLMHKLFPKKANEVHQLRLGKPFGWRPDEVAKIMGYSNPIDLVRTLKGDENAIPAWRLGRGNTPEEIKRSFVNEFGENSIDPNKLYEWLKAYEKQYKNQQEHTGGFANATEALFAPRSHESKLRRGEAGTRDIAGDIAENALQLAAFWPARGIAAGARALGLASKPVRFAEPIVSSAVVPLATNVMDAGLYDEKYNPHRSEFDIGKVAKETGINLATVPAISSEMSSIGRAAGLGGPSRREIAASISGDPFVDAQHAIADISKTAPVKSGKSRAQLDIETDIVRDVNKGRGLFGGREKQLGKDQRKRWEDWINNEAPIEVFENLQTDIKSIERLPEPYRSKALKDFYANREVVYPTELLTPEMQHRYGINAQGQLAIVGSKSGLNPKHNVPTTVDPSQSAWNLKRNAKQTHTDKAYNRESKFDEAVRAAEADPNVQARLTMWEPSTIAKLSVSNLIGNKLGKQSYAAKVGLDKDFAEPRSFSPEVEAYLNDDAIKKMWRMGFEPRSSDEKDPMVKAYKIYKERNPELFKDKEK
jgi:hypothetical protein